MAVAEHLTEGGPTESGLYRYTPRSGRLDRIGGFGGRPTAAVLAGDEIVIGAGSDLVVFRRDGSSRTIPLPRFPGLVDGVVAHVTAVESTHGRVLVAIDGQSTVLEVALADGKIAGRYDLGGAISHPERLLMLDDNTLLASTPFGTVAGTQPGSLLIDLAADTVRTVDLGRPFSFSKDSAGRVFASQAVPGGGIVEILDDSARGLKRSPIGDSRIPWDGRWDLLAVGADSTFWGSVQGSGRIYREGPGDSLDEFLLPVIEIVPSLPTDKPLSVEEYSRLTRATRAVAAIAVLADGSLVILSDSPGGALGFIPRN